MEDRLVFKFFLSDWFWFQLLKWCFAWQPREVCSNLKIMHYAMSTNEFDTLGNCFRITASPFHGFHLVEEERGGKASVDMSRLTLTCRPSDVTYGRAASDECFKDIANCWHLKFWSSILDNQSHRTLIGLHRSLSHDFTACSKQW